MKERRRSILHVDLDPFFVSVERSLDPVLRGRPVLVGGGTGPDALVAAASAEARALGVRPGQSVRQAMQVCPEAVLRPGDLETYGRFSDDVASIFQASSRRVERPSADEAYLDLTPDSASAPGPVAIAENIKDQLQRRLGLDVSLGLASSRMAARVASTWAKPRGLLLVLPGYEASFLARQPLSFLTDAPPQLLAVLEGAGFETLGQLAEADEQKLVGLVGPQAAARFKASARGEGEDPIPVTAPPTWIQEEAVIRDRRSDGEALRDVIDGLARRAARRLRPFDLVAEQVSVEVRRPEGGSRRSESVTGGSGDEDFLAQAVQDLAEPLFSPAARVRQLTVRLSKLYPRGRQATLFPGLGHASGGGRPRSNAGV